MRDLIARSATSACLSQVGELVHGGARALARLFFAFRFMTASTLPVCVLAVRAEGQRA